MMGDVAKSIGDLIRGLILLCIIFVPLGLWKLVEIIIWICRHIHFSLHYT